MASITRLKLDELKERLRQIDPDLVSAAAEVDPTTLDFAAAMSPLARLQAATRNAHRLARFRRDASDPG